MGIMKVEESALTASITRLGLTVRSVQKVTIVLMAFQCGLLMVAYPAVVTWSMQTAVRKGLAAASVSRTSRETTVNAVLMDSMVIHFVSILLYILLLQFQVMLWLVT